MHIFVADEHPLIVFADTCRHAATARATWSASEVSVAGAACRTTRRCARAFTIAEASRGLEGPGLSRSTDESRRRHF